MNVQSRDIDALVNHYSEDRQGLHIHVLLVLEKEFYGSLGLLTCMKYINSRTFHGKQDPASFCAGTLGEIQWNVC